MSTFVGITPFSNPLSVAMETIHFSYQNFFEDTFVSHSGGPNEQFGSHENWMPGNMFISYYVCLKCRGRVVNNVGL